LGPRQPLHQLEILLAELKRSISPVVNDIPQFCE
jgi:hypothetical protein